MEPELGDGVKVYNCRFACPYAQLPVALVVDEVGLVDEKDIAFATPYLSVVVCAEKLNDIAVNVANAIGFVPVGQAADLFNDVCKVAYCAPFEVWKGATNYRYRQAGVLL